MLISNRWIIKSNGKFNKILELNNYELIWFDIILLIISKNRIRYKIIKFIIRKNI